MSKQSNLSVIYQLSIRNLKCYLRDRASVFFSFLSPIILLFLYLFFLADMQSSNIESSLKNIEGFIYSVKDVDIFVYSWLFANVISLSIITVTLGASGNIVGDKESGIINDYFVTPVSNFKVVVSYFISIFVVSLFINLALFLAGQLYIVLMGGEFISFIHLLEFLGVLVLSLISIVFLIMLIVGFIKTSNAYSAFSAIVGTFAGFLIGAYMPISFFSDVLQIISNTIPASLTSALFRNIFMIPPLERLLVNVPNEYYDGTFAFIKDMFSLELYYGDYRISKLMMYIVISASIVVFLILNIFRYKRKNRI